MIVFDLACEGGGHVFEAWFGSTGDYDSQQARGLVSCPICGDAKVAKAVMAPRVSAKSNSLTVSPARSAERSVAKAETPPPEEMKALLTAMAEVQRRALATSDYVGDSFAAEARAIHLGESDQRSIHGIATPAQARGLVEDGIEVAPLPFPVRPPGTDN
ncbi:DUF1178 family protein [Sphingomonas solaris]|uniref:DUF1178 family protein n=1 Tax=Alterirhizorhabdus solaris TaxID=2529389 RepID=A0A558R1N9_9SPHN|nr:DUF1178 family protein [Sphingomonas solaris]TVV73295.1 DUF1178 family protein [Sphingomonas solaris]